MSSDFNPLVLTQDVIKLLSELNDFVSGKLSGSSFSERGLDRMISELTSYWETSRRKGSYSIDKLSELFEKIILTVEFYKNLLSRDDKLDNEFVNEALEKISLIENRINAPQSFFSLPSNYSDAYDSAAITEKRINALNLKAVDLEAKINDFDQQIKAYNARAVTAQNSVNESTAEFIENQQKIFKEEFDKLVAYLDSKKTTISENEEKINEVISVLASKALSGSFMKNALKEEDAANSYRRNAMWVMLGVSIFFVLNFIFFEIDLVTRDAWVNRIVIGIFFSFVIGYLVRQSAVHRGQQFIYQQKALDLAALSPYVASLPEEVQHKIKHQMAEKLFVAQGGNACQDTQTFGAQELLGKLIDKLEFAKPPR